MSIDRQRLRAGTSRWMTTIQCLMVAGLGTIAIIWLTQASQHTRLGQEVDTAGMDAVVADRRGTGELLGLLGNVSIGTLALAAATLVGLALLRRRYAAAAVAVALIGGANVITQLMKHLLERSDFGMLTVSSLPSGHTTAVTSVALAALTVTPMAWRPVVSLVAALGITIAGTATLVGAWHRPSDVVAALLVSLVWGCLLLAVWGIVAGGVPRPPSQPHGALSAVGVALAAVLLIVLGVRPSGGWSGALDAGVVLGAIALAAAGMVRLYAVLSAPLASGGHRGGGRPTPPRVTYGADPGRSTDGTGTAHVSPPPTGGARGDGYGRPPVPGRTGHRSAGSGAGSRDEYAEHGPV